MTAAHLSNQTAPLALQDKILFVAAVAVAAALFLSVGWIAAAPDDPKAAVSLVTHHQPALMWIQVAAIGCVAAGVASVIIGTRLADVGAFAAAIGLGLISIRGETSTYLLIDAGSNRGTQRLLAGQMAAEAMAWFVVILLVLIISGLVMRWCFNGRMRDDTVSAKTMAISECPILNSFAGAKPDLDPTESKLHILSGLKVTAVTAAIAVCIVAVFATGSAPRAIRHGQACFAVFAGIFIGVWISRFWFSSRTAFWPLLATPVACLAGYIWSMLAGDPTGKYSQLANVPTSSFLHILPMTYIAAGTAAAITAQWTLRNAPAQQKKQKVESTKQRRGKRRR